MKSNKTHILHSFYTTFTHRTLRYCSGKLNMVRGRVFSTDPCPIPWPHRGTCRLKSGNSTSPTPNTSWGDTSNSSATRIIHPIKMHLEQTLTNAPSHTWPYTDRNAWNGVNLLLTYSLSWGQYIKFVKALVTQIDRFYTIVWPVPQWKQIEQNQCLVAD